MRSCPEAARRRCLGLGLRPGTIHGRMRLCVTASWLTELDVAVARPMDGIDTSLLDSLDPSV